ncbi:hypothetical protein RHGRI_006321 [Rhododendron griersonianum]|uniref:Disease resistance protein At4g27190-like leucine-rich repeats domain-containing protein n=1 Tax=Rhododendron griersonianum TaxID=479676 RepID=A0AAV6KT35_9ERIC|nr:hypothetical protein RHGRI_006321 [Rhododendron griersonianum]
MGDLGFEEAIKAWKYVRHYTENLQKLQGKLRDLGDCTATITREVSEAIGRDDVIEVSVSHWQMDADSLKVDIEQLIGESTTKASISCIACSCPNIVWRYKFSKQAEDKIANAVELIKNCNNFNHQISHPKSHYMENLQKLKDKLRDLGDCREIIRGKVSEANGRGDEIEVNVSHWQTDMDSLKADIERLISESTNICSTECPDITWQHKFSKQAEDKIANAVELITNCSNFNHQISHSADAKACFLLCCLFAEDAEIPIDELMRFCVARNLLDQNPDTLDKARNAVRTVVDTLKSASLLTTGGHETIVKIHDVIRDVGISIAREEEAFLVDHGALRWPRNPTNGPSYKAMSLSFKNIKGLPDGLVYPRIHTLMVDNTNFSDLEDDFSDLEVGNNFFNGMTQLVVLTVTRLSMQSLPSSLAKLTNLKMLYLNKCKLADIAMLKDLKSNLEVLSLRDSSIKVLPPEIGQLTSLRVLDLQDCDELMVIPRGVISNLIGLEELYFPMTFDKWGATTDEQQDTSHASLEELDTSSRSDNASLEELDTSSSDNASLEELRESLANAQLTTLHIHIPNVKLLPKEDLKFTDLKGFRISVGSKFNYFEALISRTCMLKLKGIQLRNEFIPLVNKAEVLILKPESSVHPLRLFDKLTVLIIKHFKLKYLFSLTTARGLIHLEVLKVTSCEIMEGMVGFEGQKGENEITGEVKFSKLKELKLKSLPNLISFFAKKEEMGTTMGSFSARAQPLFNELVIFPVLEELTIDGLGSIIKIWDKQSVAVLEYQGSFCQLTNLEVSSCSKLMHVFPSNMHPLLKNLEELTVEECETMKGIAEFEGEIDEDGLRNEVAASLALEVEHLEMVGVPKITEIWDKQPLPELKKGVESLCKLMYIHIERCGQLLYVFPSHMLPQNLQELKIKECDELEVIFSKELKEKEAINNDIIVFPQLKNVTLWTLRKLESFYTETQGSFFSHKVVFPVLKHMHFGNLDKITRIWDDLPLSEPEKEAKSFSELEDIDVHGFDQLEYVLPSYMLPQLKNLQKLSIWICTKVEVIISNNPKEKEATNNNDTIQFPQLKKVYLPELPNLKSFICSETQLFFSNKDAFPVLEDIELGKDLKFLRNETSTKEVSIEECGTSGKESDYNGEELDKDLETPTKEVVFPVLKQVSIWKLDKITRIWDDQPLSEPEKEAKSFSELENIFVGGCDQLEYVLPSYMLLQLKNLQELKIQCCTKVEVIISNNPKEKEATNNNDTIRFPQLKALELEYLPNLKSFIHCETKLLFSNKDAFPVLRNPRPKPKRYQRHPPRPLLQEGGINSVVQLDESGGGVTQFQSVEEGDSATSSTHILPQASGSESALTLPALEEIDHLTYPKKKKIYHLDANLQIFRIGTYPQRPKPECYRGQPQRPKPKHNRGHPPRPLLQEGKIPTWQGSWCGEKSLEDACTELHVNIDKLGCGQMKMDTYGNAQGSSSQLSRFQRGNPRGMKSMGVGILWASRRLYQPRSRTFGDLDMKCMLLIKNQILR